MSEQVNEAYEHDPNVLRHVLHYKKSDQQFSDPKAHVIDANAHNRKLNHIQFASDHVADAKIAHKPLNMYSESSSSMNYHLIRKYSDPAMLDSSHVVPQIEELSNHIKKHAMPLPEDAHFYSGTRMNMKAMALKVGQTFHTPAFTSTSTSMFTADNFAGRIAEYDKDGNIVARDIHIIHFKLPKGYNKGMVNGHPSKYPGENEYLLDKGQNWKIVGHKRVNETAFNEKHKHIIRNHIWTVEPAEHHSGNIHESYIHDPKFTLRKLDRSYITDQPIDLRKKFTLPFTSKEHMEHADTQHAHDLTDHQYWSNGGSGFRKKHYPLYQYSQDARNINVHLINKSVNHNPDKIKYNGAISEDEIKKQIRSLTSHINKHAVPLDQDGHFYSGVNFDVGKVVKNSKGIFHTPAFTSTSVSLNTAATFIDNTPVGQHTTKPNDTISETYVTDSHIIHFKLPKGYKKGMYIGPISEYENEREYLLNKNQKWKVVGHQRVNQTHFGKYSYSRATYQSKHVNRIHIWTVEPHVPKSKKTVAEAYTHDVPDSTIKNSENTWSARGRLDPRFKHEHDKLTNIHKVSPEHDLAIKRFTGSSIHLNTSLVNNLEIHPMFVDLHDKLQDMFKDTAPLEREHHVYSGLGTFDPSSIFDKAEGKIHLKGYTSTSINPEVAVAHSNLKQLNTGAKEDQHIIHFKLPKGYSQGRYIANHSKFPGEHEMIINHGQKFKLIGKRTYKNDNGSLHHVWSVEP